MALKVPVATYRMQFNRRFGFNHARALVPYLQKLGATDLYASPLLRSRRQSPHGYDVVDPLHFNPELGTEEEFKAMAADLKSHGMGLVLDIVPNHMAASTENPWWMDVLENSPSSAYAFYFDIDWTHARGTSDKILVPILGGPYESVLGSQELMLTLDQNGLFVQYHETRLPLDPKSYQAVLAHRLESWQETLGAEHPTVQQLMSLTESVEQHPARTETNPEKIEERRRNNEIIKQRLWNLYAAHPEFKDFLDENIKVFNGAKGDPRSFDLLDQLLANQAYRLTFWRMVTEEINYRRFFDISDLISVRVEDPRVFEATHALIFRLAKKGAVTGLRVDHIDGLYDPVEYLGRLQNRLAPQTAEEGKGPGFYVVVEKILLGEEALPEDWPVYGTTGYDFLNKLNGVFVDPRGIKALDEIYTRFIGCKAAFSDICTTRKKQVIEELFDSEARAFGVHLGFLAEQDRYARDLAPRELSQALVEVTASLPVYRTYIRDFEVPLRDRAYIECALQEARLRNPKVSLLAFDFLRRVLLLGFPVSIPAEQRQAWLRFVRQWQQFTGPVMAKGVEDTALYVYNRLASLNDVGSNPEASGLSVEKFHRWNQERSQRYPYALNATSTHDTKRSEDVRARIHVLSELPLEWEKCLSRWSRGNRGRKQKVDGGPVPDSNQEMLLYQALIGAWPLLEEEVPTFRERLKAYLMKAAREAKVHTSWLRSNETHESALLSFVDALLEASATNRFLKDFLQFQKKIAYYGAINALAQVLLKIVSRGVPDFYQGTELWDFSLVDPDNRRPVDFPKRIKLLEELKRREADGPVRLVRELLAHWQDGRIKLYVTSKALGFRRAYPDLFLHGDYLPLYASGKRKENVCAFARRKGHSWALVAVPRLLTKLVAQAEWPLGQRVWGKSALNLPHDAPLRWLNVLTGETLKASPSPQGKALALHHVVHHFPVALLSGSLT